MALFRYPQRDQIFLLHQYRVDCIFHKRHRGQWLIMMNDFFNFVGPNKYVLYAPDPLKSDKENPRISWSGIETCWVGHSITIVYCCVSGFGQWACNEITTSVLDIDSGCNSTRALQQYVHLAVYCSLESWRKIGRAGIKLSLAATAKWCCSLCLNIWKFFSFPESFVFEGLALFLTPLIWSVGNIGCSKSKEGINTMCCNLIKNGSGNGLFKSHRSKLWSPSIIIHTAGSGVSQRTGNSIWLSNATKIKSKNCENACVNQTGLRLNWRLIRSHRAPHESWKSASMLTQAPCLSTLQCVFSPPTIPQKITCVISFEL